jgi:hypothetical protein
MSLILVTRKSLSNGTLQISIWLGFPFLTSTTECILAKYNGATNIVVLVKAEANILESVDKKHYTFI